MRKGDNSGPDLGRLAKAAQIRLNDLQQSNGRVRQDLNRMSSKTGKAIPNSVLEALRKSKQP